MSEMRNDLLKTVDRIFEEHCPRQVRESAEAGEWPAPLWQALEEVGLSRAALPEEAGGSGLDFDDAMMALRRSAYHAAPVPLAETMLAGRLLAAAGIAVPPGALTVAPVQRGDQLALTQGAAGVTLTGRARRVPWGNLCAHAVVAGELGGKGVLGLVATAGAARTVEKNLAGEPRVLLEFAAAPLLACAALDDACARLEAEGALLRSVQMAGALERTLEYSLQYANERVQFGRPIAKFQAVQHMLAQLAGQVAAASAAVDAAVEASSLAPDEFAVAVAKSRAGEAAGRGAEIAHQVHGAMGYTREHNLHYATRRLWSWRDEFGNETYWQSRLGRAVAAQGADALWPMLSRL
ncbi:MAG TPA: acyl-CoA dehydrogenase family protein [Burkholderiales bacterium]|nr:acyl-CoA dehydrogenase family protein [Burkholderiales bacterium]